MQNRSIDKEQYGLFEVFGVELEYMIVDKHTLNIKPLCDKILRDVTGEFVADYENGRVAWSNELVNHVIELKTNGPVNHLHGLDDLFHQNITRINLLLKKYDARLLPGGVHPWMNPFSETQLWKHDHNAVYELYNRIFDCRGHGWSNLQSTHINLPFAGDDEFGRLHAAIRLILPIIPALSASSPILDGKVTGFTDSRLEAYLHNQDKIPSLVVKVIPERVFTEKDYYRVIFNPIKSDMGPFDQKGILKHHFLNSRGAIARFDRGAIEIRVIDIQECPKADLAILEGIVVVLKQLVDQVFVSDCQQKKWHENQLSPILLSTIQKGESAVIENSDYLRLWGVNCKKMLAAELWEYLIEKSENLLSSDAFDILKRIIQNGTLSTRIVRALKTEYTKENQRRIYQNLAESLQNNQPFKGN